MKNKVINTGLHNSGNWNSGDWNSGNWNSGYRNSGNWNSGDGNSGHWNSGDGNLGDENSGNWNSGDRNSGDWNSGDWNSGFFNTGEPEYVEAFNRPCKLKDWLNAKKPKFLSFSLNKWVKETDMSDAEKEEFKDYKTSGGYLKQLSYKEAWREAWENKEDRDIKLLEALPNFDWEVFTEISGIEKP